MKQSSKFLLRKLCQVCFFVLLASCKPSPLYTSSPTLLVQTPTLPPTATETPIPPFRYIVTNGDTCVQIAFNFNISKQSILDLNNLQPSCPIEPGQELLIPYPTVSNIPTSTLKSREIVFLDNTLKFERNGKYYPVKIATSQLILTLRSPDETAVPNTQSPELPADVKIYQTKIKDIVDIDNDGEQEYIVLLNECTKYDCSNFISYIKIYKYNPEKDEYYVLDEYKTQPEKIE